MSILKQINKTKKVKSNKYTPISEGGLGLSNKKVDELKRVESDIRKAKENLLAKYWYDKYEELVKEVSYERKLDRQNLNELDEKMHDINEDLINEVDELKMNDPLTPLEQKFVTFDKLSPHYSTIVTRLQQQIETIGGGGIGDLVDDPSPQFGGDLDLNSNDITGTGNITHTGNLTTTGNAAITGTLGVEGVTTFSDEDVIFTGNNTNMRWDHSTSDLILFNDTRLEFGSNKDFEIWHGGTHTFMKNSGGDLRIRGDVIKLAREDSSERYIECNVNNAVQIFHNGTERITTSSTGVTVGGNIVISDDGNIGSSSDTDAIAIAADGTTTFSSDVVVSDDLLVTQRIRHVGDTDT